MYSWPLNIMSLNGVGPFICRFFSINVSWESVDVEDQMYASIYAILYRGLEHPQILVSARCPGTDPMQIPKDNLSFGGVKSYAQILDCVEGWCPCIVQGSMVMTIPKMYAYFLKVSTLIRTTFKPSTKNNY